MEQVKIELKLDRTLTTLAGNPYGHKIYQEQARDKMMAENENIIVFPSYVEFVAPSFIQGFIAEFVELKGKDSLLLHMSFYSENTEVVEKIYKHLMMAL